MDLSPSIEPKSDQLNADDLISGPVTVTIVDVTPGSAEQPVNVTLAEYPGRPYRPSKSMRRVMVTAWGRDSASYTGRRLVLFRNPSIRFGADQVGGIQISHLSHIGKPLQIPLTVKRGQKQTFKVQPLAEPAPAPAPEIPDLGTVEALRDYYQQRQREGATPDELGAIAAAAQAKKEGE
jgi:hypothetical protein